jgi:hypothetical protein
MSRRVSSSSFDITIFGDTSMLAFPALGMLPSFGLLASTAAILLLSILDKPVTEDESFCEVPTADAVIARSRFLPEALPFGSSADGGMGLRPGVLDKSVAGNEVPCENPPIDAAAVDLGNL